MASVPGPGSVAVVVDGVEGSTVAGCCAADGIILVPTFVVGGAAAGVGGANCVCGNVRTEEVFSSGVSVSDVEVVEEGVAVSACEE